MVVAVVLPVLPVVEVLPAELVGEQHDDPVLGSAFELADGGHLNKEYLDLVGERAGTSKNQSGKKKSNSFFCPISTSKSFNILKNSCSKVRFLWCSF